MNRKSNDHRFQVARLKNPLYLDTQFHWAQSRRAEAEFQLAQLRTSRSFRLARALVSLPKNPLKGVRGIWSAVQPPGGGRRDRPLPVLAEPQWHLQGAMFHLASRQSLIRVSCEHWPLEIFVVGADIEGAEKLAVFLDIPADTPGIDEFNQVGWSRNRKGELYQYLEHRSPRALLVLPDSFHPPAGWLQLRIQRGEEGSSGQEPQVRISAAVQIHISLRLSEQFSEEEAYKQILGQPERLLLSKAQRSSLRLSIHQPATEGSEILMPCVGKPPQTNRPILLRILSVKVEGTSQRVAEPDQLRSIGLSYSRRVGWYQYGSSATAGSVLFRLNSYRAALVLEGLVEPWEEGSFLTDLPRIRQLRKAPSRPRVGYLRDSPFAHVGQGRDLSRMRVAAIADAMTASALSASVDASFISRHRFIEDLRDAKPDVVFVESAWQGNNDQWRYAVGHYGAGSQLDLFQLTHAARSMGIPTVFWNKEDPIHFSKFASAASHFDQILTTDQCCVERYKASFPSAIVGVMPFFVLPEIHNPFFRPQAKPGFCFGGSFYGDRHPERSATQAAMLDSFSDRSLDIYDRNHWLPNSPYKYPERFAPFIRGGVPYEQMPDLYKSYDWFLNVNTVTESPTMYARRVPELLACGTGVITNPSQGISATFTHGVRNWEPGSVEELLESTCHPDAVTDRLIGALDVIYQHAFETHFGRAMEDSLNIRIGASWKEFALVLTGSNEWLGSQCVIHALEELKGGSVEPEVVVVVGREEQPPHGLEKLEATTSAPLVYVPLQSIGMLEELGRKRIKFMVANEATELSDRNAKSLLCTARVAPSMLVGLSTTYPTSMVDVLRQCGIGQESALLGPWLFSGIAYKAAVQWIRMAGGGNSRICPRELGMTSVTAPRVARPELSR